MSYVEEKSLFCCLAILIKANVSTHKVLSHAQGFFSLPRMSCAVALIHFPRGSSSYRSEEKNSSYRAQGFCNSIEAERSERKGASSRGAKFVDTQNHLCVPTPTDDSILSLHRAFHLGRRALFHVMVCFVHHECTSYSPAPRVLPFSSPPDAQNEDFVMTSAYEARRLENPEAARTNSWCSRTPTKWLF